MHANVRLSSPSHAARLPNESITSPWTAIQGKAVGLAPVRNRSCIVLVRDLRKGRVGAGLAVLVGAAIVVILDHLDARLGDVGKAVVTEGDRVDQGILVLGCFDAEGVQAGRSVA